MKKIRIGNDFVFNWAIERGGLPEDLSSVLEKHLHLSVFGKRVELVEGVDYDITGNVIRIEVTPTIANIIGTYKAEFHYILPDNGLIDEDRKCAVDVDAFQIVAKTAQADDSTEFSMTSDMAIAFKGDKGDSAYQVWLDAGNTGTEEDYFAYLRQPAIDAGDSISELEGEIQSNEGLRVSAESERDLAEGTRVQAENERLAAEIIRQSNEGGRVEAESIRVQNEAERISKENVRQSNEIDRVEAESERVQAESERAQAEVERQITIQEAVTATNLANEKANLANIAAQNANEAADSALTATQEATTAASLADTARLNIQDDLALKADQTDLAQLESDVKHLNLVNLCSNNVQNSFNIPTLQNYRIYPSLTDSFISTQAVGRPTGARDIQIYSGHIYYCSFSTDSESKGLKQFSLRSSVGIAQNFGNMIRSGDEYVIIGTSSYDGVASPSFTADLQSSVWNVTFNYMVFCDLTLLFDEGNEPSMSEFRLLLSILGNQYFEGEITLTQKQIMNWQLKMIRQNRNAIIALGGTII